MTAKIKGYVDLRKWTPKIAANAARNRLEKIELLFQEISGLYGDVYQPVVWGCDEAIEHVRAIRAAVAEAEEVEAGL